MVASITGGPYAWGGRRDREGHREFKITHRIKADFGDGPATIMDCPGIPIVGTAWAFENDSDIWAFCTPEMTVRTAIDGEKNQYWLAEQVFSTKPQPADTCEQQEITDPLLMPQKISGTFVKYTKEATRHRLGGSLSGALIKSSSHEPFRGPQVEFDANRPTVRIEQNVAFLDLSTFSSMIDTVNSVPMWGLGTRRVKLSNVAWSRNLLGTCGFYYTRVLDFDVDFNTFDRDIADEGSKVLRGEWDSTCDYQADGTANSANPADFIKYVDCNGNPARALLNGAGLPLTDGANPVYLHLEYYEESNFFVLGIPSSF